MNNSHISLVNGEQRSCQATHGHRTAHSALIIEDDILIAWAVRDVIEGMGYSPVMVATTDHSADLAADDPNLALVICDLDLGAISATGFDILERIDKNESIPTIIYTGIDRRFVEESIKVRRPKSIILEKPADDHELKAAVSRAVIAGSTRSPAEGPVQRHSSPRL